MPLSQLPLEELRQVCRHRIETCELWLRRLVDERLRAEFGDQYLTTAVISGQPVFNRDVQRHVEARMQSDPSRYARPIDTLLLDQLAKAICRTDLYGRYFAAALAGAFPLGAEQFRATVDRLIPIRNALSHANQVSVRQGEQAICYAGDIVDSLKSHYKEIGMDQAYAAPSFVRFFDSYGNERYPTQTQEHVELTAQPLYVGDRVVMEVEVDASFPPDSYGVIWSVSLVGNAETALGHRFDLLLGPQHVNQSLAIFCSVVSGEAWHRHGTHDASLWITYQVRPLR